jgi:transcriptional regulator with XRE-family HTH domain
MPHPLREYRERHGKMSQQALAEKLGVSRMTVIRWEMGHRKIDQEKLPAVCQKTGISPRELRPDLAELLGGQ